jgi:phage portal protein BeeE
MNSRLQLRWMMDDEIENHLKVTKQDQVNAAKQLSGRMPTGAITVDAGQVLDEKLGEKLKLFMFKDKDIYPYQGY